MNHIPVLLHETIEALKLQDGNRIVDATFGGGGHTTAILESADCFVLGVDRDPEAQPRAETISAKYGKRFRFLASKFSEISNFIDSNEKFDGILFDFGISSFQVDDPKRGFSFMQDGPLDMRMSKNYGISAYEVVNSFAEQDLANIIWTYGDEPKSRRIAAAIVGSRAEAKIDSTSKLREIVTNAVGSRCSKIDPATKAFQAIRIYVNDELTEINTALEQLPKILKDGARIVTISFHSLEDRIVKNWARNHKKSIESLKKNVIKPSREEVLQNPRARSAVLRGFVYVSE